MNTREPFRGGFFEGHRVAPHSGSTPRPRRWADGEAPPRWSEAAPPRWSDYAGPPTQPRRGELSTEAKVGLAAAALGVAVGIAIVTAAAAHERKRREA